MLTRKITALILRKQEGSGGSRRLVLLASTGESFILSMFGSARSGRSGASSSLFALVDVEFNVQTRVIVRSSLIEYPSHIADEIERYYTASYWAEAYLKSVPGSSADARFFNMYKFLLFSLDKGADRAALMLMFHYYFLYFNGTLPEEEVVPLPQLTEALVAEEKMRAARLRALFDRYMDRPLLSANFLESS